MTLPIGLQRLSQLADHLDSSNRGLDRFDFAHTCCVNQGPYPCGTSGCAMGEMPALWPDEWAWTNLYGPLPPRTRPTADDAEHQNHSFFDVTYTGMDNAIHSWSDVRDWFQIDQEVYELLFYPRYSGDPQNWRDNHETVPGVEALPETATAHEVAENIRAYVRYHS